MVNILSTKKPQSEKLIREDEIILYSSYDLLSYMKKEITFHAVATDVSMPIEINHFFQERIEIRSIFGTKCYVILEDEETSPLNLLDEEFRRKVERWLVTVASEKVFSYTWKPASS